jgi:hypothetical protein
VNIIKNNVFNFHCADLYFSVINDISDFLSLSFQKLKTAIVILIKKNVDIKFSAHDAFLEYPSSGSLKS